jgi:hypothetical protein
MILHSGSPAGLVDLSLKCEMRERRRVGLHANRSKHGLDGSYRERTR